MGLHKTGPAEVAADRGSRKLDPVVMVQVPTDGLRAGVVTAGSDKSSDWFAADGSELQRPPPLPPVAGDASWSPNQEKRRRRGHLSLGSTLDGNSRDDQSVPMS